MTNIQPRNPNRYERKELSPLSTIHMAKWILVYPIATIVVIAFAYHWLYHVLSAIPIAFTVVITG